VARILRGDIVWADLDPVQGHEQGGRRPVVVISQDVFNTRSGTVIAFAVTSQQPQAGFPLSLELDSAGLPKRSWVKISQIRTISVQRIGKNSAEFRRKNWIISFKALTKSLEVDEAFQSLSTRKGALSNSSDASKQKVEELRAQGDLTKYRCLHFATHGAANNARAFESVLYLSQDKAPKAPISEPGKPFINGQLSVARC
jgi:mRNA interferase MazF